MSQIVGHISQVIGPVVDVYFEGTEAEMMLPSIHDALEIKRSNGKRLIVEVLKSSFSGETIFKCNFFIIKAPRLLIFNRFSPCLLQ